MAVPKYIREVPRPVNTVVIDNGKDGPTRYAVRERKGVQYVSLTVPSHLSIRYHLI